MINILIQVFLETKVLILKITALFSSHKSANRAYFIGEIIDRQIKLAFEEDFDMTKKNINTPFIAGYIEHFARSSFHGPELGPHFYERFVHQIIRQIKDVDLETIYEHQQKNIKLAKMYGNRDILANHSLGETSGQRDANKVNYSHKNVWRYFKSRSLFKYLVSVND